MGPTPGRIIVRVDFLGSGAVTFSIKFLSVMLQNRSYSSKGRQGKARYGEGMEDSTVIVTHI